MSKTDLFGFPLEENNDENVEEKEEESSSSEEEPEQAFSLNFVLFLYYFN